MSKYIDVEWLIARIPSEEMIARMAVVRAPTIDIVFCRECKYWEKLPYEAPKDGWCNDPTLYCDGRWTNPDDFCSYGERREP